MTLTSVPGIRVGHAEVPGGKSGCTVVLGPFRGAVAVGGFATGTRELDVLSSSHLVERADAILLTGGSAFGLAAADGVMEWLAQRDEGFDTGFGVVPIVPGAVIFDLRPGVARPGATEGRRACEAATSDPVVEGCVGAGSGATVGKILGPSGASPGGIGSAARTLGTGVVGVMAVVNALGDVVREDGTVIAGARAPDGTFPRSDQVVLGKGSSPAFGVRPGTNTTLVVVASDLPLSRVDLGRVAQMSAGALPRAITPVNTPFDGDVLFSLSSAPGVEEVPADELLSLGVAAREVTEEAIRRAVSDSRRNPLTLDDREV
ncbi:MAG: P1 family peptidase [Planctomycetota bacterium]|jgi:L-aminopeptidase/D-esterase-like protein